MIDLNIQIKLIIFSFIFGFLFSIAFEMMHIKVKKCKKIVNYIFDFFIIFFFTIVYFVGLIKICNGIFHIYSILIVIVGVIFYDVILSLIANDKKK